MKSIFLSFFAFFLIAFVAQGAEGTLNEMESSFPKISTDSGLTIESPAKAFTMRVGFRVQSRFSLEDFDDSSTSEDLTEFQIRRMRLRLDGNAYAKNIRYNLQFSFSRGDQDWDTIEYPNILRDANVSWEFAENQVLIFGLRKLPGNRQRVVSSGALEFVDRSIANATFNIDRDVGIHSRHQWGIESPFRFQTALTSGEGRGQVNKGTGLSVTTRVEWLPLGLFKEDGDYFESDLLFEDQQKVSLGLSYNNNYKTHRLGGQTGSIMDNDSRRNLESFSADFLWKFQGYALSLEHHMRNAENPIISSNQTIFEGAGSNIQFSYVLPSLVTPALRWTHIKPQSDLKDLLNERTHLTVGLSKYIHRHRLKIQSDYTHETIAPRATFGRLENNIFRLQFEFGI
jgi:hypothetical protein